MFFFRCDRCISCKTTGDKRKRVENFKSDNGKIYEIEKFITCHTRFVTYLLTCPCVLKYVGRTTRPLFRKINEHVNNIKKGCSKHNVSNQFRKKHNRDPSGLKCIGIDRVYRHWRGSHLRKQISQNETWWIHEMGSLWPIRFKYILI